MSSNVMGTLYFYPDEKDPSLHSTFRLREGENLIGSSSVCDIKLVYPNISSQHCKITLSEDGEYSIEDLGSDHGVYRVSGDQGRQKLKAHKEYELVPKKVFHIADRYKCLFEINEENDEESPKKEKMDIEDQPTLVIDEDSPPLVKQKSQKKERGGGEVAKEEKKTVKGGKNNEIKEEEKGMSKVKGTKQNKEEGSREGQKEEKETRKEEKTKKKGKEEQAETPSLVKNFKGKKKGVNQKEDAVEEKQESKGSKRDGAEKEEKNSSSQGKQKEQSGKSKGRNSKENEETKEREVEGVRTRRLRAQNSMGSEEEDNEKSKKNERESKKEAGKKGKNQEEEKKESKSAKGKGVQEDKKQQKEKGKKKASPVQSDEDKPEPKGAETKGKRKADTESLAKYEKASTSSKKVKVAGEDLSVKARTPRKAAKDSVSSKGSIEKSPVQKRSTSKRNDEIEEEDSKRETSLPKRNSVQVMFSGIDKQDHELENDKRKLGQLGVKVVEDRDKNFTVLVMKKFKRTIKFLVALAKGIDIVDYKWVKDSINEGTVMPTGKYIYSDKAAEVQFKFKVAQSLEKAKGRSEGLLENYRVYLPNDIKPTFEEVKLVVESMGGTAVKTKPNAYREDMLVVLNGEDEKNVKHFKEIGFEPYTTEVLFSGILQQKLNLKNNKI